MKIILVGHLLGLKMGGMLLFRLLLLLVDVILDVVVALRLLGLQTTTGKIDQIVSR